jgi:hypothetical protein
MATPISEVVAQNSEVLKEVKAFLTKAENPPETTPEKEEEEGEEETTTEEEEEKKEVTRDEFDALYNRVAELEKKLDEKDEQNAKLMTAVEASTDALTKVHAFFKSPSNRAMLAEGEETKPNAEAVETTKAEKNVAQIWMEMTDAKAAEAFFKANKAEIEKCLKGE